MLKNSENLKRLLNQIAPGTVAGLASAFLVDCSSRNFSKNTIKLYTLELGYFQDWLEPIGAIELTDLTPDVLRHYMLSLAAHRNPGGCHVSYRVIKTFLRWAWEELEMETRNPIVRVDPPSYKPKPLPGVPIGDIHKMIDACTTSLATRDRAILRCLLDTGARSFEFVALNLADVDLMSGSVLIGHGKGDKSRVVYVGKKCRRALRSYLRTRDELRPADPLWLTDEGERLEKAGLREILKRRAIGAGLTMIPGAHDFRRAFAVTMLRNGCDLATLARLMGHSSLQVLMRYLALLDQDTAEAHRQHSPVDNADL